MELVSQTTAGRSAHLVVNNHCLYMMLKRNIYVHTCTTRIYARPWVPAHSQSLSITRPSLTPHRRLSAGWRVGHAIDYRETQPMGDTETCTLKAEVEQCHPKLSILSICITVPYGLCYKSHTQHFTTRAQTARCVNNIGFIRFSGPSVVRGATGIIYFMVMCP